MASISKKGSLSKTTWVKTSNQSKRVVYEFNVYDCIEEVVIRNHLIVERTSSKLLLRHSKYFAKNISE